MAIFSRKRTRKIILFHLASFTWPTVHMFTLLNHHVNFPPQGIQDLYSRNLYKKRPNMRHHDPIQASTMDRDEKNLEFLWEDEDDDNEYSEPFRSSPESYKVRQRRRGYQTAESHQRSLRNNRDGLHTSLLSSTNISMNHTNARIKDSPNVLFLGRKGYNVTLLSLCQYDYKQYKEESYKQSWQLRLNLLKDFQAVHGHLFVPYRYTVMVNDYTINGTMSTPYPIHMGRWLYQIRKLYRDKPHALSPEQIHALQSLGVELVGVGVGRRPGTFQNHLKMLQVFQNQYGHCHVPRIYPENPSLGLWVERQRSLFRRKSLTDERVQQLLDLGFDFGVKVDLSSPLLDSQYKAETWINSRRRTYGIDGEIWSIFERYWQNMLERLSIYKQCHGDCNVPINYIHDLALGLWVAEQRREYTLLVKYPSSDRKMGLSSLMTVSRFRRLTEMGFNFSAATDSIDKILPCPWRDVAKQEFDLDIVLSSWSKNPQRYEAKCIDDVKTKEAALLYLFLRRMKWEQVHSTQQMSSQSGIRKWYTNNETLREIMGDFTNIFLDGNSVGSLLDKEYEWWDNFFDMARYKRHHGNFDIQPGELWYSEKLWRWLELQIDSYNRLIGGRKDDDDPELSERHFQALVDLGFSFHDCEQITNIDSLTPGRKPSLFGLERNVNKDITKIRRMQQGRLGKLRDLVRDHSWFIRFEELRNHLSTVDELSSWLKARTFSGNSMPQSLSYWLRNQLDQYHRYKRGLKSTLSPKRISLLESIGCIFKIDANDREEWSIMIDALKDFKTKYGHCFVPPSWHEKKLGRWLHKIRSLFQQSMIEWDSEPIYVSPLPRDQIRELVALGVDIHLDDYTWSILSYDALFYTRVLELRQFKEIFRHCNVVLDYNSPYFELSLWVREQRILYKRRSEGKISALDSEKIQLLDELQFDWQ